MPLWRPNDPNGGSRSLGILVSPKYPPTPAWKYLEKPSAKPWSVTSPDKPCSLRRSTEHELLRTLASLTCACRGDGIGILGAPQKRHVAGSENRGSPCRVRQCFGKEASSSCKSQALPPRQWSRPRSHLMLAKTHLSPVMRMTIRTMFAVTTDLLAEARNAPHMLDGAFPVTPVCLCMTSYNITNARAPAPKPPALWTPCSVPGLGGKQCLRK